MENRASVAITVMLLMIYYFLNYRQYLLSTGIRGVICLNLWLKCMECPWTALFCFSFVPVQFLPSFILIVISYCIFLLIFKGFCL